MVHTGAMTRQLDYSAMTRIFARLQEAEPEPPFIGFLQEQWLVGPPVAIKPIW